MTNTGLTKHGEAFIKRVATYFNNSSQFGSKYMLQGTNGVLPFSDQKVATTWTANVTNKYNNTSVTNNDDFADYIIKLFNEYGKQYNVDPNLIAAQAFVESEYRCWIYNNKTSTASGIPQIVMKTLYWMLYTRRWLLEDERDKIVDGLTTPEVDTVWKDVKPNSRISEGNIPIQNSNHTILHQNMIDNPDLLIKLQCRIVDFISKRNNNFASSTMFAYSRGSSKQSTNYIQLINNVTKNNSETYADTGCKYVEDIFGYLGDPQHKYVKKLRDYVKGYSFAYKINFGYDEYQIDTVSDYTPSRSTKNPAAISIDLRNGYDHAVGKFKKAHPGYNVTLTSVYRTPEYQNELYRVGRNSRNEIIGKTLTPLSGKPGSKSFHNFYKTNAFDYGIFDDTGTYLPGLKDIQYKPIYGEFYQYVKEIVPTALWGGNSTKQVGDVVHIEVRPFT